jgi:hypothetical protein
VYFNPTGSQEYAGFMDDVLILPNPTTNEISDLGAVNIWTSFLVAIFAGQLNGISAGEVLPLQPNL